MSAGFKKRDSIISIAKCWHGLERLVKAISLSTMTDGGPFDFSVIKSPVEHWVDGIKKDTSEDKVKLVDGSGHIISVVGNDYGIVQPERFGEMVINSMADIPHNIQTAMTLDNRRKLVVSVELTNDDFEVIPEDGFLANLIFISSLDGSSQVRIWDSIINVVCANTLAMAMHDFNAGSINLRTPHTKNVNDRIPDLEKAVQTLGESRKKTLSALVDARNYSLSVDDANKVIAGWQDSTSTRAENVRNQIVQLFQTGIGNKGENASDLINGVTEYYTHHHIGEKADDRSQKLVSSSEFGTGAKHKARFVNSILADDGDSISDSLLDKLADKGDKVLKERKELVTVS